MPASRSAAATPPSGTSSRVGPAPTRWTRRWPASSRSRAAARPASSSSGTTTGTPRRRPCGSALSRTAGTCSSRVGIRRRCVYIDARMMPSTWRSSIASSSCCSTASVALGLPDEQHVAVLACRLERALDHVAGELRRGDGVRDEPQGAGGALAQPDRGDVRAVAQRRRPQSAPAAGRLRRCAARHRARRAPATRWARTRLRTCATSARVTRLSSHRHPPAPAHRIRRCDQSRRGTATST